MPLKFRQAVMYLTIASAIEGYAILIFAPQLRPTGGLGRLGFRLFLLNFVIWALGRLFVYPFFLSPLRDIPGPTNGNLFVGNVKEQFSRPPAEAMRKWMRDIPNKGLLRFRTLFNNEVLIATSHETLKGVLLDHAYDYEKPPQVVSILRRILGDGLILVEGSVHKFQRKHLLPSFQFRHIKELYPMFWSKSCELTESLHGDGDVKDSSDPRGFEFEFGEWCMRATLDIIGIAGFGRDFNALKNPHDELIEKYTWILEPNGEKLRWFVLNLLLPQWIIMRLPWHLNTKLNQVQKELYLFALNLVKERRKTFAQDKVAADKMHDILSLLVKSNDFDDNDLAQQTLTMMAAGHETTSSALSWIGYLLSKHPEFQKKVRDEVRAHLPSPAETAAGKTVDSEMIDNLTYLNAVCLEVVRLYPTVPMTVRQAVRPTPLGGKTLPTGTVVMLLIWAINRDPAFWGADATEFKPERWINADGTTNKTGGSTSNYAQMTFLHGPRSCIGQNFAQSELKCLVAAIVGRYEFSLAKPEAEYYPAGAVTTKPANGMWLNMKRIPGW